MTAEMPNPASTEKGTGLLENADHRGMTAAVTRVARRGLARSGVGRGASRVPEPDDIDKGARVAAKNVGLAEGFAREEEDGVEEEGQSVGGGGGDEEGDSPHVDEADRCRVYHTQKVHVDGERDDAAEHLRKVIIRIIFKIRFEVPSFPRTWALRL